MVTGIDCSKDYFDVVLLDGNRKVFEGRFANNPKGFQELLPYIQHSHVVMEHKVRTIFPWHASSANPMSGCP